MTPEQFLIDNEIIPFIPNNEMVEVYIPTLIKVMQEYTNLQKPEWIPIKSVDEIPDDIKEVWLTRRKGVVTINNTRKIKYHFRSCGFSNPDLPIAWMPYTEPTPYQPQPKISKVHGSYGYKVYDDTDGNGNNFSDADPGL